MRIIILIITLIGLGIAPAYSDPTATNMAQLFSGSVSQQALPPPSNAHYIILAATNKANRKPVSGMTMRKVKRLFGDPIEEMPSTGSPPITRWVYASFTVYFEGTRVIHAVKNRPRSGKATKG